jgi:hypothetical protein
VWILAAAASGVAHAADAPDLDAIVERLQEARPDFTRAAAASGVEMPLAHGRLTLTNGALVPATFPDDSRTFELVFVGHGRIRIDAPDAVEAQQLASFTGHANVDAQFGTALLVFGDARAAAALLENERVEVEPALRARAETLLSDWVERARRRGFGADDALLRAALGDPLAAGFFGAWLPTQELGSVYYCDDPSRQEPVSFGRYALFHEDDFKSREEQERDRRHDKTRRKLERKLGRSLDDYFDDPREKDLDECAGDGTVEVDPYEDDENYSWTEEWLSAAGPGGGAEGRRAAVEPDHYRVDLSMEGADLQARGNATVRLLPAAGGLNVLSFWLIDKLDVCEVTDETGRTLAFHRRDHALTVALARPTQAGVPFEVTVRYAGQPVLRELARHKLRSTVIWHPHTGVRDLATYDVTLRWPQDLTLLAAGRPVEEGAEGGRRFARYRVDVPTKAYSFEIGEFDVVQDRAGHIDFTFGFHGGDREMTEDKRAEIVTTAKAAVLFFESQLGLLPTDRLVVTVVDRGFSQGLFGFVTLAEGAMHATLDPLTDRRTGQEVRLAVIAHEVAHQWWGHVVGWDSYRDQWLSEGLATFSSAAFMKRIAREPEVYERKIAEQWRHALRSKALDGMPLASLGPVVLGRRLDDGAYHAIVYEKGAAVFATLAQRLGVDPTWKMLGELTRAVANRVISTPTFFRSLEHMSGQDLGGFVRQYVEGTGIPALFYRYRAGRDAEGGWTVEGDVRQLPAEQFRYELRRVGNGWDVSKRRIVIDDPAEWSNVVPFHVEMEGDGADSPRTALRGKLSISGERTSFSVPVPRRPVAFALDPDGQILAEFTAEDFRPKRFLLELGLHLGQIGRIDEALETLERGLAEQDHLSTDMLTREADAEDSGLLDVRLRLARARLMLDTDQEDAARRELRAAEDALPRDSDYHAGERTALATRLDLRKGSDRLALDRLRAYVAEHSIELSYLEESRLLDPSRRTALKVDRGELLGLLAIASHEMHEGDRDLLVRLASEAGIDMAALAGPGN